MSWTWQGRQLATAEKGGTTLSYTYDSEGIRTSKTVGSTTTKYLLNGTQILAQTTNGKTLSFFYDQQVTHRMFVKGVQINGIPIMP